MLGFLSRIENAKRRLTFRGSLPLDNREFIGCLLDTAAPPTSQAEAPTGASSGDSQTPASHALPMLEHIGN